MREDITIYAYYDRLVIYGDGGPERVWHKERVLAALKTPGNITPEDVDNALAEINEERTSGGGYWIIDGETLELLEQSTYAGGGE